MKSLDRKLEILRQNPKANEFIIADAKDADMAWGVACPGTVYPSNGSSGFRSMTDFLEQMREMTASGLVDILLASNSAMSRLAHEENLFADSEVTPAIRANDTTDVWISRVANYRSEPSRPFRSAYLREAQYGSLTAERAGEPKVNLGLYSITFNNDLEADYNSMLAFREFRLEAAEAGFDYFLEVFAPNVADCGIAPELIPSFVNDSLVRALAGVSRAHWPKFLKIPYFGPQAMEELAAYDDELVVGILGGGPGTTYDAFKQLAEAKKYGARVALYGRKIKEAEHPIAFVRFLRAIAEEKIGPEEAVKAYHGELQKLGIPPKRDLAKDSELTAVELSYAS
ncbi:hypothetical protein [Pelagicoccus sp. SDUM812003]|uniref:hypothetical protein n=1 Tax=Pelagicoccus sp. SDUM812003 TaxID=3041267 RepID=UPI00280EC55A|nr:hypothetical protein [Pelagicoccus sp. SDUM812003]MDQ8201443.1 hypothetical protein [Pelagicoccus sp. SDUM812003]